MFMDTYIFFFIYTYIFVVYISIYLLGKLVGTRVGSSHFWTPPPLSRWDAVAQGTAGEADSEDGLDADVSQALGSVQSPGPGPASEVTSSYW
jgi:hypothetical protein